MWKTNNILNLMESNIEKIENIISPNSKLGEKEVSNNNPQKNEQIDLKKLITKIDNRVKTKVRKQTFFFLKKI